MPKLLQQSCVAVQLHKPPDSTRPGPARPRRRTSGAGQTLSLPGTLQGAQQAPIAARATGYVKRWTRDIGASVQKGELLAEIESPEIDQQLSQAIAARQQTAASLALAKSTTERWEALRKRDVVSQQELDEKRSAAAQANAINQTTAAFRVMGCPDSSLIPSGRKAPRPLGERG